MAKKPKKDSGLSVDELNKFLVKTLLGSESEALLKQAGSVEAPRGRQGNMVNQFGSLGMTPETQKLVAKMGLGGKAAAYSNVADLFGVKDAYKFLESGNPSNAAWAALSVAPFSAPKGAGKKVAKQVNALASYLLGLFGN